MATYTAEQRSEAIALVAEVGLAEAWRQLHIPKPTLVLWCQKAGVERSAVEQTRKATETHMAVQRELRERLRTMLLEKAVDLIERMDAPHVEFKGKDADQVEYPIAPASAVQNYATSAAILIDKYRLEVGEATGRTETVSVTDGLDPEQKRALRERLVRAVRGESEPGGAESDPAGAGSGLGGDSTPEADPA